jgi:ATP-binding cassette, subfamily C, bacterial LapB
MPEGYRPHLYTLGLATFTINILSLALPLMSLQIYDRIIPNVAEGTLYVLIGGTAVMIALEMVMRLCRAYLQGLNGATYAHKVNCRAMKHLLGSDMTVSNSSVGVANNYHNISSIKNLKELYNGQFLIVAVDLTFVPLLLGMIAYIGGSTVWIALGLLIVFAGLSVLEGRKLHGALLERDRSDDSRLEFLISTLNAIHSVKAFAAERILLRRYEDLQTQSSHANLVVSQAINATINQGILFSQVITAATVAYGAWRGIHGAMTIGAIIAIVQLSGRLMQPIQRGLMLWTRYQDLMVAQERVSRLFAAPLVVTTPSETIPQNDGRLDIKALRFQFHADHPFILDGIDVELVRGQAISIGGATGSGKTTLLKLIAGIHRPTAGSILVDGLDTTSFPAAALSRHVGYMSSDATIFRGTIRDNITRFGEVPAIQAMAIAEHMELDHDIAELPGGLDTRLDGLPSDSIPPGLKQRLAILRAIVTKPRLLLFDNADRALDVNGYTQVYRLLGRLKQKAAIVIVSDDKNLCGLAERHYVLQQGKLVENQSGAPTAVNVVPYRELRL